VYQFTTTSTGDVSLTGPIYKVGIDASSNEVLGGIPSSSTLSISNPNNVIQTALTVSIDHPSGMWVSSGSTMGIDGVTVTVSCLSHGLTVGERVFFSGVDQAIFNGIQTITSIIDANTFTFVIPIHQYTEDPTSTHSINVSYLSRIGDVGFSTRQSINVNFSQNKYSTKEVSNAGVSPAPNSILTVYWINHPFKNEDVITISDWIAYSGEHLITVPTYQTTDITAVNKVADLVTIDWVRHPFQFGGNVALSGLPTFNGTFQVTSLGRDQFTFISSVSIPSGELVWTTGTTTYRDAFSFAVTEDHSDSLTHNNFLNGYAQVVNANKSVKLNVSYFQDIDGIQTYLSDSNNRVLACDQLARGFNLTTLDVQITGYNNTPDSGIASTTTIDYLKSLLPGQTFIMGDLLAALFSKGISSIKTPISISYATYRKDLLPPITGSIVDTHDPLDNTNIFVLNSLSTTSASVN
jgi:hypothetical protein